VEERSNGPNLISMLIDRLLASTEYARTISRAQKQADNGIRMGNHSNREERRDRPISTLILQPDHCVL
jgi:hypothetical protein